MIQKEIQQEVQQANANDCRGDGDGEAIQASVSNKIRITDVVALQAVKMQAK